MSLRHWIWLTLEVPQAAKCLRLLDALESPERIYSADRAALTAAGVLKRDEIDRLLAARSLEKAQAVLLRTQELGIQVITLRDAAYPDRLRNIDDPPPVLYCKGTLPTVDDHVCVAVVGTRKAGANACRAAEHFAFELAKAGILIVSGMAAGIDAQGHQGALRAGTPTIAVFGCGLDICFPAENRGLMEKIIANGCILSEYPPGVRPTKFTFPARNRIIAGLSMGVLVGAAPQRSGSLITARLGLEQGRDVFAIPGGIDDPEFSGCNACIKEGAALVTEPEDILREYRERWPELLGIQPAQTIPVAVADGTPVETEAYPEYPILPTVEPKAPVVVEENNPGWRTRFLPKREKAEKKPAPKKPAPKKPAPEPAPAPAPAPARDYSTLSADDQAIIRAIRDGARRLDRIIDVTGLPVHTVISQLVILEVEGLVRKDAADNVTLV